MDITVLDKSFETVAVIDTYDSFIWADRFAESGDFELYTAYEQELVDIFQNGYYMTIEETDKLMFIESVATETDADDGWHLKIKGRSLEYLIHFRVVYGTVMMDGNLQDELEKIFNDNIIAPSDPNRKIDNFVFKKSDDDYIKGLTIESQVTGKNIYDLVVDQCKINKIGYRIKINSDDKFEFSLYSGTDRSYSQDDNQYVVFSPFLNNLASSNFVDSTEYAYNVALVGGEGTGVNRLYSEQGSAAGLDRRELFVDARDLTRTIIKNGQEYTFPDSEYVKLLRNRGKEKLREIRDKDTYEAEADLNAGYVYMEDYDLGDIVQLENEFGRELRTRIVEMIFAHDGEGVKVYPTFKAVTDEEDK